MLDRLRLVYMWKKAKAEAAGHHDHQMRSAEAYRALRTCTPGGAGGQVRAGQVEGKSKCRIKWSSWQFIRPAAPVKMQTLPGWRVGGLAGIAGVRRPAALCVVMPYEPLEPLERR